MSERENGGPAFPVTSYVNASGSTFESKPQGMSLRDYFAARAMPEAIRHHLDVRASTISPGNFDFSLVAVAAYKMADAMLAERNK